MLTYEDAKTQLGKRETKKLARNTYLRSEGPDMIIRFWSTDIISIDTENNYTLNSGGYHTLTTKERLNEFTPARVCADKGLWYVYEGRRWEAIDRKPFADGVRVDFAGNVVDGAGSEDFPAIMRKVDRLVSKYIADYAAHVMRLGAPEEDTGGDCFYCQFGTPDTKEPMGFSHYLEHAHENYFVPSILMKAIAEEGYNSPAVIWHMMKSDLAQGREPYHLKNSLRKFFRSRKIGIAQALADGWKPQDDYDREEEGTLGG